MTPRIPLERAAKSTPLDIVPPAEVSSERDGRVAIAVFLLVVVHGAAMGLALLWALG